MTPFTGQLATDLLAIIDGDGEADIRVPAIQLITMSDYIALLRLIVSLMEGEIASVEVTDITHQQPELPLG